MFVTRANQELIFKSFTSKFVTTILGARRVGKSFLVKKFISENSALKWVQLNMDNHEEREAAQNNQLRKMIEEKSELQIGGDIKLWIVIDEAQKCPELFEQVKIIYDEYKGLNKIKIILTGSGYLHLHQYAAETLAGRVELYYLREFGLQETANLIYKKNIPYYGNLSLVCEQQNFVKLENHIQKIAPLRKVITETIMQLLIYGGLPEVLEAQTDEDKKRYLSGYLQTYLEKDVRAIRTIENLELYKKLMSITAEQTGSIRQDTKTLETLSCNRETLKKYRNYLTATLMYHEIYPFIGSTFKRLTKSPKGFLLNNGLITYLTRLSDIDVLEKTGLIGHRFENWFLNELLIWNDRDVELSSINYWRTSAGVEVDFVVEKKPNIYPFEVTYSTKIQNNKVKNLQRFLSEEPNAKIGYYIYLGDYRYDAASRICFLPAWAVM